jgi:hypothetical protein
MVTREQYVESGEVSALPYEVGVYTQGKVGSKAVLATIREMFLGDELAGDNMYVWDYRRSDFAGTAAHQVVQGNRRRLLSDDPEIAQFLVDHPDRDMKLTTMVREPIAINISSFFYNFAARNPEVDINDVSDSEIVERLIDGQSFSDPSFHLTWFDIEVKPMTGIDVYKQEAFPITAGSDTYEGDAGERHTSLLAFRLEDLPRIGAAALAGFYHKPEMPIAKVNSGDEQSYASRYKDFKNNVSLPVEWVAWQLNSEYARFFYNADERAAFSQRWSGDISKIV